MLTELKEYHNEYRPICFNLPSNPGSIYWLKALSGDFAEWDMNYFDYSFNGYDSAALFWKSGDALPIKLICTKWETNP